MKEICFGLQLPERYVRSDLERDERACSMQQYILNPFNNKDLVACRSKYTSRHDAYAFERGENEVLLDGNKRLADYS